MLTQNLVQISAPKAISHSPHTASGQYLVLITQSCGGSSSEAPSFSVVAANRSQQSLNNCCSPERYFYASCSLSEDIFGPFLGNQEILFLSQLLPGRAEQNNKGILEKGQGGSEQTRQLVSFDPHREWSDICLALDFLNQLVYHHEHHLILSPKPQFLTCTLS